MNEHIKKIFAESSADKMVFGFHSDAAPYKITAGKTLQVFYRNLIHVMYSAHEIHG